MKKLVYKFPDAEIRRYTAHGIAHAKLNKIMPIPLSGCYIDLEEILKISPPKYAWMKLVSDVPHIIISSGKQVNTPKSVFVINQHENLVSLELKLWHNTERYGPFELIPIYNK